MNADRHRTIGELYHQALEMAPEGRDAFLRKACDGDSDLFREVASLLAAHDRAGDFIATPAIEIAAAAMASDAARAASSAARFSKIGPYTVISLLGRGGMGEVYRGRDTRLGRDVALKVLPERYELDGQRLERFEREAKVLASLNHPNIAVLYGIEEADGRTALVMELVDGLPLTERIRSGPMPLAEALPVAVQIAEALEAAHEQGVIHRDLKPANITIRPDGTVKVLDFGLAKVIAPGSDQEAHALSVTRSGAGVVLGTASYMSPEQARGASVDQRTDIWAFGCVLYEMLAGHQAFAGASSSDVVARVLEREPDFGALPATTPPSIQRLLRRCLTKNVRERLRHIGDAVLELNDLAAGAASEPVLAAAMGAPPSARVRAAWIALSLAAVALTAFAGWRLASRQPALDQVARFAVAMPAATPLVVTLGPSIAISSDGTRLAVRSSGGAWTIRRRDRLDVTRVGGNGVFVSQPFFSPDGNWLAFADGPASNEGLMLKRVPSRGGTPQPIVALSPELLGATWAADDTIVFATHAGLFRVPAGGGVPKVLLAADRQRGEVIGWPEFLPGDRWLLFTITGGGTLLAARLGDGSLGALDVKTGARRTILPGVTHARYVPTGHLVYTSGGTLYAVAFDAGSLEVRGEGVPLLTDVRDDDFALSADGTLAYVAGNDNRRELVWVDRTGREEAIPAPPRRYVYPSLSPDGTKVALDIDSSDRNIWILDLRRETMTRLTFDPGEDLLPVWTPDGMRIVFSRRIGNARLYWQPADGSASATLLNDTRESQMPLSFTPDGKSLILGEQTRDLFLMSLDGSRRIDPLLVSDAREIHAALSPDGRWLAYTTDETGQFEVCVRPFPNVNGGKWQISRGGGSQPLWSRDGRELFYRDPTGAMLAASVNLRPSFVPGTVKKLFDGARYGGGGNIVQGRTYDLSPDGRRFLMIKLPQVKSDQLPANNSLIVVQNWFDEVKRLTSTN